MHAHRQARAGVQESACSRTASVLCSVIKRGFEGSLLVNAESLRKRKRFEDVLSCEASQWEEKLLTKTKESTALRKNKKLVSSGHLGPSQEAWQAQGFAIAMAEAQRKRPDRAVRVVRGRRSQMYSKSARQHQTPQAFPMQIVRLDRLDRACDILRKRRRLLVQVEQPRPKRLPQEAR